MMDRSPWKRVPRLSHFAMRDGTLLVPAAIAGVALLIFGAIPAARAASQEEPASQPEKTAEQVYKNIQVFKGVPSSQLLNAMFFMESSLHTGCEHCHTYGEFEKDEKASKLTARRMILMVRQLNDGQFNGKPVITCNTCHRGQTPPSAPLSIAKVGEGEPPKSGSPTASADLPPAEQLTARHLEAVGGESGVKKIHSRVMKGTRLSSEGWSAPVEVDEEAPNKWMDQFELQVQFVEGFDGLRGWLRDDTGVHNADGWNLSRLKQAAEFYSDLKTGETFEHTVGKDTINGHDAYLVEAEAADGGRKQLYFDAESGLLLRVVRFDPSPFGPIPNLTDYADYREVDGVKIPFTVGRLRPDYSVIDKFTEIKQNVTIPASKFARPTFPSKP